MNDSLIGKEIDQETLRSLIVDGRIKFHPKDTSSLGSAISSSADDNLGGPLPTDTPSTPEDEINNLIDEVVKTEGMVKTLEDLYDLMTKDMRIPPASKDIAEAADLLGANNGIITKEILDRAENIIDMYPYTVGMGNPFLGALTGDPGIAGDYLKCNSVTGDYASAWKTNVNTGQPKTSAEATQQSNNQYQKANDDFKKKMRQMGIYLMKQLWWEQIYARVIIVFLTIMSKVLAKPIDTPMLLLRWKKLSMPNYEKYGPVHKLMNRIKVILLCRIPKVAFPEYRPDDQILIYLLKNKTNPWPPSDGYYPLVDYCSHFSDLKECEGKRQYDENPGEDISKPADKASEYTNTQTNTMLSEDEKDKTETDCSPTDFLSTMFQPDDSGTGMGISPACVAAAKTVLDAVKNDALYYSDSIKPQEFI